VGTRSYRRLWAAVLEQAVKDARGGRTYHIITEEAQAWFHSKKEGVGSFIWVCRILDLDPSYVREKVDLQPVVRATWRPPARRPAAVPVETAPMSRTGPDLPIRIAQ
jgi:hypothetical protein